MDLSRALGQLADIHQQIAKGEIYRGYRSVPIAASGLIGFGAAWTQAPGLGVNDPVGFVLYWTAIAGCAALVGTSEIIFNYVVRDDLADRRRTRQVVGQFLPSVLAGAIITASLVHLSAALVPLLPGLWAICFGLGQSIGIGSLGVCSDLCDASPSVSKFGSCRTGYVCTALPIDPRVGFCEPN